MVRLVLWVVVAIGAALLGCRVSIVICDLSLLAGAEA
jgi:hypothetical protein